MDPNSQQPVVPKQQIAEAPAVKLPTNFKKILNYASWTSLVSLAPIALVIFLSQNSQPGDFFYPLKRGLENVVLAAATVSPATKIAFRTDLTNTRYKEAEMLLLAKDTSGLNDFVNEVYEAQSDLSRLKNVENKKKLSEELITKIEEYETKLTQAQSRVAPGSGSQDYLASSGQESGANGSTTSTTYITQYYNYQNNQTQDSSQPKAGSGTGPSATATSLPAQPTPQPIQPIGSQPKAGPIQPKQIAVTVTIVPTSTTQPAQTTPVQIAPQPIQATPAEKKLVEDIQITKLRLKDIKKTLEDNKGRRQAGEHETSSKSEKEEKKEEKNNSKEKGKGNSGNNN